MSVHDLPVPPAPALPAHDDSGEVIQPLADLAQRPRVIPEDDNPHKLVARYRKARKIATTLRRLQPGVAYEDAVVLGTTEVGRTLAAEAAGTRIPSEVTWALVVEILRDDA